MANPAPGFLRRPDYRITIGPGPKRVRAVLNGRTIADSGDALWLREADYPPVCYLPRADVRMELAVGTDRSTHCPYKGDASYWSFTVGDRTIENLAWSYEAPFDEMIEIAGRLAFYRDRVDEWIEEGPPAA